MIRTIQFGSFPAPLSAVCFGGGRLGGDYDEKKSFELLDLYYSLGGRFIDTAACYGRWGATGLNESERCIGKWLKERGVTDMVIASKCCHYDFAARSVSRVNRACAEADLDESRRALGLDVVPIYLTHRDDPTVDVRRIVDFLADMVKRGSVTRVGLSNYRADRVRAALDYLGRDWKEVLVGVENEWSLHEECLAAENGGEKESPDGMIATGRALLALHRSENLPLFAFSAAAHGFYGKKSAAPKDERKSGRGNAGADERVWTELERLSEETGLSPTALSVAYLLNAGVPAVPIVAVSNAAQMKEFERIAAFGRDLSRLSPLAEKN